MQDTLQTTNWFDQRLADGGPLYTETNLDHFIAEPWNMVSSLLVIIPSLYILFLNKNNWRFGSYIIFSTILFAIALFFRQFDAHEPSLLPVGTHFLWHVFGAIGTFYILYYLYHYRDNKLKEKQAIEKNHSH